STTPCRVPMGHRLGRDLAYPDHWGRRKLVLVRHGQTDYNVQHRLPGQLLGIPLNEEGKREARATAEALRELPLSTVVASPLERTMDTAGYLNERRGLTILPDAELLDTDYGRFRGQVLDELDAHDRAWKRFSTDTGKQ